MGSRDKLVSKLKQKEIDKMEQSEEKLRQSFLYSDDSMEDISDEELENDNEENDRDGKSDLSENLDEISGDDELRLTSTDNDENDEDGEDDDDAKKSKAKKKKKEK